MAVEADARRGSHLHTIPPLTPKPNTGLPIDVKIALDKIGAKCTNIINNSPLNSVRMLPIVQIQHYDLEKVSENLYRPKIGSFPMKVTKYLAENFNLQTITYQKSPGVLDAGNKRLPQDYHLVILLQGTVDSQGTTEESNIDAEYSALSACIQHLKFSLLSLTNGDIDSINGTLNPPPGWLPPNLLSPIVGATLVVGIAISLFMKK